MAVEPFSVNTNGMSLEPIAYRIEQVESVTGLSRSLIYDEVGAGRLVRTKVRGCAVWLREDLLNWLRTWRDAS
jgi:predicted DNA-binding transcriptional regulator AlpA